MSQSNYNYLRLHNCNNCDFKEMRKQREVFYFPIPLKFEIAFLMLSQFTLASLKLCLFINLKMLPNTVTLIRIKQRVKWTIGFQFDSLSCACILPTHNKNTTKAKRSKQLDLIDPEKP